MSVHLRDEQRRLLPRWRESEAAARTAEATPLSEKPAVPRFADTSEVDERLRDWRQVPNIATAADAISVGFVLGVPQRVREPAEYLLANERHVASPAVELARRILGIEETSSSHGTSVPAANHRAAIAMLRARLAVTARDPLAYVDLARRHAALGQTARAERSLRAALSLAPNSRFVLRSASRFFVHIGDPEKAQDLLRRALRTRTDPWLLAAEISAATVAGRSSRFVKVGRDFASAGNVAPVHISELVGALGTLEIIAGNRKQARRFFAQAMLAPTDNSLAQAQWASSVLALRDLPSATEVPRAFEARALAALRESAWDSVVEACFEWLDDEPFSHKSPALGSFAAATGLGDHERAILLAAAGLTANPDDQTLRNNLVYSLANIGRIQEAVLEASRAKFAQMDSDARICWTATVGLLNYRLGNATLGREHYVAAIQAAQRLGKDEMAAVALLNWAMVTAQVGDDKAGDVRARALALADEHSTPAVQAMRRQLDQAVAGDSNSSV